MRQLSMDQYDNTSDFSRNTRQSNISYFFTVFTSVCTPIYCLPSLFNENETMKSVVNSVVMC